MNMGFVFFLSPEDGRMDWERQILFCLSPGVPGYMAQPVSLWLGEVRGRRAEAARGSSGAIERRC